MTCVLCQFELPKDSGSLAEYNTWMTGKGLTAILALKGLQEFRAYRDHGASSGRVTAMLFFEDIRTALQASTSDFWRELVANVSRWGSGGVQLTVLEPSPTFPQPIRPVSSRPS